METLKFQTLGPSGGPALVCLHGFLGMGSDWISFAQELHRIRPDIQILLPDLPGHGESVSISPQNFTARLCETLDAARISHVALAGYSLGGRLALAAAIEQPHRFPAFVGISTTAGIENPDERNARREADAQLATQLRQDSFENFLRDWWSMPVFSSSKKIPADEFLSSRLAQNPAVLAEALESWSPGILPSLWSELPAYPGFALLLAGEGDSKFSSLACRMAEALSSAHAQILPACGHRLLEEAPCELASALAEFLPANFGIGPAGAER